MNMLIRVNHLPVDQIVNAEKSMVKEFVHVYNHTLELLQRVDQSVLLVPNVLLIKPA